MTRSQTETQNGIHILCDDVDKDCDKMCCYASIGVDTTILHIKHSLLAKSSLGWNQDVNLGLELQGCRNTSKMVESVKK